MDHNSNLDDSEDLEVYLQRDLCKRSTGISPPYRIVKDEKVGRHMVASRDIKPGEIIFVESPLTFGPSDTTKPVCLGCYNRLLRPDYLCSRCGYPMCGKDCQDIPEHRDFECKAFSRNGFRADLSSFDFSGSSPKEIDVAYAVVSPVRALMLREADPARWDLVWRHMSHDAARKKSAFWRERTQKVMGAMKKCIDMSDPNLVRTAEILLGILLVNDFEISTYDRAQEMRTTTDASIRALFALASMPSHSCVANSTHDFSSRETGFVMTMRAVVKISKGEDITHSYTEPLDTILQRRSLLQVGKFFQCNCPRCSDPTELGTYSSALRCSKCPDGRVIPGCVERISADWRCDSCGNKMACEKVQDICRGMGH